MASDPIGEKVAFSKAKEASALIFLRESYAGFSWRSTSKWCFGGKLPSGA